MARPNEYGEIQQGLVSTATANPIAVTHQMGTLDYCMFLTQDITDGVGALKNAMQYCPDLNPGNPTTAQRQPDSAYYTDPAIPLGGCALDLMLVTAHSMLDVGPVAGQTRTTNQIYRRNNVYNARPAYRSLHRGVPFSVANNGQQQQIGGAWEIPLLLTHRMVTSSIMVFGTPSSRPQSVAFYGFADRPLVRMGWRHMTPTNTGVIQLFLVRDDGLAFDAADAFTFDVMVVSAPAVGHSVVYHGNRSYTNPAFPPIAGAPWSVRPDYRAGYPNAQITGVDTIVRHNSHEDAAMLLFGYRTNPSPLGFGATPYVVDRATSVYESTVDTDSPLYAYPTMSVDILTVSPHSLFTSLVVPAP